MNKLIIIFLGFLLSACNAAKQKDADTMNNKNTEKGKDYPYEVLIQDSHGGYDQPQILVIREPMALQDIYGKINMTRKPGFPYPEVDFEIEMIIALCMGKKTTGGYSIGIDSMDEGSDTLLIRVRETEPEGMAAAVISQPFCLIKLPATNKKIVFEKALK